MSINFPTGATPNQIYSYNGLNWIYTGTYWKVYPQFTDILPLTGGTFDKNTETLTLSNVINDSISVSGFSDYFVTGGTYDSNTGIVTFLNTSGGSFNISGFTSGGGTFTGGTVSGATIFTNGLTATTISATTYLGDTANFDYFTYGSSNKVSFHQQNYGLQNFVLRIDELGIIPIYLRNDFTIYDLNIFIGTANAGNSVFGLYEAVNGVPSDLIFETTPFNNGVISSQSYTLPSPINLKRGLYYVAYNSSSGASYRACAYTTAISVFGVGNANGFGGSVLYKPLTYTGNLPPNWNLFPGTIVGSTQTNVFPHVVFRIV